MSTIPGSLRISTVLPNGNYFRHRSQLGGSLHFTKIYDTLCDTDLRRSAIFQKSYLFPHQWKIAGWIFAISGFTIGLLRFQHNVQPRWLEIKVFAVYYSFFESKYFSTVDHNVTDEIAGILLLCGLIFLCFSREKIEDEHMPELRLRALLLSLYANTAFLILSIIVIYGIGFITILVINLFSLLFFYFIIFSIILQRHKKKVTATGTV